MQFISFYTLSLLTPINSAIILNAYRNIRTYLYESNFKEPGTRRPPANICLVIYTICTIVYYIASYGALQIVKNIS